MSIKLSLNSFASLANETSFISQLNANFVDICAQIDLLLSRDGEAPNTLLASLDVNSQRLINLLDSSDPQDAVTRAELQGAAIATPLPIQTGNAGRVLQTDGTILSWGPLITTFGESLIDDLTNTTARATLGLGDVATLNVGVANGNICQFDVTGYPAADGSQITSITATITPQGKWEQISRTTASTSAFIDRLLPTGYDLYRVYLIDVVCGTDDEQLVVQLSNDAGVSFINTGTYDCSGGTVEAGGTDDAFGTTTETGVLLATDTATRGMSNVVSEPYNAVFTISGARNAAVHTQVEASFNYVNADSLNERGTSGGHQAALEVHDAIRFIMSAGSIISGTIIVTGLVS